MKNKKDPRLALIDDTAIFLMILVILLSLIITGFRFKNHEHCSDFQIRTKANFYRTDEPIRFETDNLHAKEFRWDFGDNEKSLTNIPSVVHAYHEPGEYLVVLTINGTCVEYKTIFISREPKMEDPLLVPQFIFPPQAEVGKAVTFKDTTPGARTWEWRFGETAAIDATASSASYTYKTPGLKTISLVLNNDPRQLGVCKVYVNDKTVSPNRSSAHVPARSSGPSYVIVPAKPTTSALEEQVRPQPAITEPPSLQGVSITKQELESKLRGVVNNYLTPDNFSPYFCNNLEVPVSLNGIEITFAQFCTKLSSIKNDRKIKQLNVQQIKNSETNCVIGLNVSLKMKQGFLGIF